MKNLISAYIDRELPGKQMLSIRDHLNSCPECHQEWQELSSLKGRLGTLPLVEPPADFEDRVLRLVRQSQTPAPVKFTPAYAGMVIATSVAAACLALLVFQGFRSGAPQDEVADAPYGVEDDRYAIGGDTFGHPAPALPVSMSGN